MHRLLLGLLLLVAPLAHAGRVDDLLSAGKVAEAIETARREARGHPADVALQEQWIDLLLSVGLPDEPQRVLAERARTAPDDPDVHYLVGRAATSIADSTAAYERALRLDPDHARAYMGLGALARARGAWREAAELYQRALKLDATLAEAWAGLLASAVAGGDRPTALQVAQAACKQVPTLAEAWLARAAYDPANAGATLDEAVRQAGQDARVHAARAEYLLGTGQAAAAAREADTALRLDPLHSGAILARMFATSMAAGTLDVAGYRALVDARALEATDAAGARTAYDGLIARYPRTPLTWMARAGVLAPRDPTAAQADLERALALDPDNDEATAALGMLLQGRDPARAATLLGTVLAHRPYDPTLTRAHALALGKAGDVPGAAAAAAAGEKRFPYDLQLVLLRMGYLVQLGDREGAWQAGRAALERMPDPRVTLAAAAAARDAGHLRDAADLFDRAATQTGKPAFAETAKALRRQAAQAEAVPAEANPTGAPRR
ncbi:MAG: tetratricopeptide repeat protein [Alphaproteobacteria bacterium]|nr:tetratricopeptide repeat protein [Alphaproteobacteria bacterium]